MLGYAKSWKQTVAVDNAKQMRYIGRICMRQSKTWMAMSRARATRWWALSSLTTNVNVACEQTPQFLGRIREEKNKRPYRGSANRSFMEKVSEGYR
jgi:hypothetical protein